MNQIVPQCASTQFEIPLAAYNDDAHSFAIKIVMPWWTLRPCIGLH